MAKRGPGSDLNDRNWDDEEEPEEAGVFAQATTDVLQQRTIKKAKRRVIGDETGTKSSAFSGFSGFGDKKTVSSSDTFSGFKKLDSDTVSSGKASIFGGTSSINGNEDKKLKGRENSEGSSSYLNCLKSLNESALAWIKQHMDSNPYIILTPVFKDYEKYLDLIQVEKLTTKESVNDNQNSESVASASTKVTRSVIAALTPKPDDDKSKLSEATKAKPFTFGQATAEPTKPFTFGQTSTEASKPFTFGQTSVAPSVSGGFSFAVSSATSPVPAVKFTTASSTPGAGFFFNQSTSSSSSLFGKTTFSSSGSTNSSQGMFSFGKTSVPQESSSTETAQEGGEKDDDYEPPKPEVKDVVEADALYSIRCKLYNQKQGQWVDRGVGNLHLKPVADNKTQLLIRADTNLGNVLLNIMLSSSLPASRQGKNNVVLVCVPNPPLATADDESTPVPMLIRVKTGEDADELLAKIDERKKLL